MQQVIKGSGTLLHISGILSQRAAKEVLFVVGHHLLPDPVFQRLLNEMPIPHRMVHPPEGVLQMEAIPVFATPDTIVAIGGGKVIDYAKGIIYRNKKDVHFIAAPTTAGSGSEATPIAVFYSGKEKISLEAPALLPHTAILDASLLQNLPSSLRAISGSDALAQCVESIWNVHSTAISESFAITGLALLRQHLSFFCRFENKTAAEEVLWGAHLAGKAIALTRTTGPHALSYYLTANYHIPHGQAVALTLPLFFLYNEQGSNIEQLKKVYNVLEVQTGEEAFNACRHFLKELDLATTLTELGLQDIEIDAWLSSVNQQRFVNNPVPFDAVKLKDLFLRYLC